MASAVDRVTVDFETTLRNWAEGLIKTIQGNMEREGVNASGETSASLEYVLTDTGIQILGAEYFAERTEVGRTPTRNPQSFDFAAIIAQWIKDKGVESKFDIGDDRDLQKVSKAIAFKISREGSAKYRGDIPMTDVYSTAIDEAVDELTEQLMTSAGERLMGMMDAIVRQDGDKVTMTKIK